MRLIRHALTAAVLPTPALAEVLDTEPSIAVYWSVTGAFLVATVGLSLWRPRAGFVALAFWIGAAVIMLLHVHDPYIGPAIRHEDPAYHPQVYACAFLALVAVPFTFWLKRCRGRRAGRAR